MRHSPLVLLHGFAGAPASYDATRGHLRTYPPAETFAPYLPGHGPGWEQTCPTSRPTDHSTSGLGAFESEVSALSQRLNRLGLSPARPSVLVGYSLGARLALGLVLLQPHWFSRCVLIGVNPGLAADDVRGKRALEDEARARQLCDAGLDEFLAAWQSQSLFDTQKALPEAVLLLQAQQRSTNTALGLAHSLRCAGLGQMPNYALHLATIRIPVNLVVGELDVKFREIAEHMLPMFANAELAVVPGVGHNVPLERPEALAAILDALPEDS